MFLSETAEKFVRFLPQNIRNIHSLVLSRNLLTQTEACNLHVPRGWRIIYFFFLYTGYNLLVLIHQSGDFLGEKCQEINVNVKMRDQMLLGT